jgi:hypothetical protein
MKQGKIPINMALRRKENAGPQGALGFLVRAMNIFKVHKRIRHAASNIIFLKKRFIFPPIYFL